MALVAVLAALSIPVPPEPPPPGVLPVPSFPPVVQTVHGRTAAFWYRAAKRHRGRYLAERERTRRLQHAFRAQLHLGATGLERAFLCIHSFEGSWGANTGNGFYGGLQMDSSFMRSYGGPFLRAWGTAN